jgi:hypothetical protein
MIELEEPNHREHPVLWNLYWISIFSAYVSVLLTIGFSIGWVLNHIGFHGM